MAWVVIFGGGALIVACVAWFTFTTHHPGNAYRRAPSRSYIDRDGDGTSSPWVIDGAAEPDADGMSAQAPDASLRGDE